MIYGERVRQARQLNSLTQAELAKAVSIDQSTVAHTESGRLAPSDELIEAIAFQTGFPPSFFRQPPEEDVPLGSLLFRSRASASSHVETRAYRYAQVGYRLLRKLLEQTKPISLRLPSLQDEDAFTGAQLARTSLGLTPDKPIENLVNALERAGVIVFSLPISLPKIDAFSTWADERLPMIILSRIDDESDGSRLRYSVAHETAHLVLHRTISGDRQEIEREANIFAGELLFPTSALREEVVPPVTLSSLAMLKVRWKMSLQALVMRVHDADLITDRQKKYLFQQLSLKGWRQREPGNLNVPVERPQTLPHLAQLHFGTPIDYAKLASRANLTTRWVRDFVEA